MTDRLFFRPVTVQLCRKVAGAMEKKFKKALGTRGKHADLATQILNRATYKNKKAKRQIASCATPAKNPCYTRPRSAYCIFL